MSTLLKERLADDAIAQIACVFSKIKPNFASQDFIHQAQSGIHKLELKARVYYLIDVLAQYLPSDFAQTALLLQQVPQHWSAYNTQDNYSFAAWPIIDYVAVYGLNHPDLALQTLKILTPLFTAEFAIRPFLQHHFDLTYGYLQAWAKDENHHVRRLASEGCRPRLPWGQRVPYLMSNHQQIMTILEQFKDDSSDYVQRSVANNLNDISKDYPEKVIGVAQRWLANEPTVHRQWIIKHATRGLVKAGHSDALALLGYSQKFNLKTFIFLLIKHK
ncbi:MAG: DNA alkylation repair protein [Moraxellaceae bacterium]|nr:DNA alkylation repair protein [Moraxellaceae bacterium]